MRPHETVDIVIDGLRWHCQVAGAGPTLLMLHGFPYTGFQFRHIIPGLVQAGFRVVVPDLPGVGSSERPDDPARSTQLRRVGDLIALLDTLDAPIAGLIGHDVGSTLAFAAAQVRPDRFRTLVMLSTPPALRAAIRPSTLWSEMQQTIGKTFYQSYFSQPEAVRELNTDVARTLRAIMFSISGLAAAHHRWQPMIPAGHGFLDTVFDPMTCPAFLSAADFAHYVSQYSRTGFQGALAPYRSKDPDWELGAFLSGCRPMQPALFLGGASDPSVERMRSQYDTLHEIVPNLRGKPLCPGVGHGLPEEAPQWLLDHLIPFLRAHHAPLPERSASTTGPHP